jgi:hypothetical protein
MPRWSLFERYVTEGQVRHVPQYVPFAFFSGVILVRYTPWSPLSSLVSEKAVAGATHTRRCAKQDHCRVLSRQGSPPPQYLACGIP